MTNNELKSAVADKLTESGIWVNRYIAMRVICQKVAEHTDFKQAAHESMFSFLSRFVGVKPAPMGMYAPPFRPLSTLRHPRADDIDRSQPPFMTPRGAIGNGDEHSKVWRR